VRAPSAEVALPVPDPAPDAVDLPVLLARTLEAFVALAHAQRGFLLLYRGFELTDKLAVGVTGPEDDAFSATLAHRVLWQGGPVWLDDLQQHPALAEAASVQALGLRVALGVPLEHGGEVIGVLLADTTDVVHRFDPADMPAALALAKEAAAAIATARRLQAAQAEATAARRLARLALAAAAAPDLEACWPALAEEALALTGAARALYLEGPELDIAAWWLGAPARGEAGLDVSVAIAGWVRDRQEPLHLLDARDPDGAGSLADAGVRTVWAAPAVHAGRCHGVLYLDVPRVASADPGVLDALAGLASVLGALAARGHGARSAAPNL
jgi:signal transduction protein with GAF and PtsI domain